MLKAKISDSVRIGEVKLVRRYLKNMTFEKGKIHNCIRVWLGKNEIGLTDVLKVELTAYELQSTVVHVIACGVRHDIPGVEMAFVEIFFIYEKGLEDETVIVKVYK